MSSLSWTLITVDAKLDENQWRQQICQILHIAKIIPSVFLKSSSIFNFLIIRLLFKLPRVVLSQKEKFEEEDVFKKHSRDCEVKYTLYRDRPLHERIAKFQQGCRDGHTEIVSIFNNSKILGRKTIQIQIFKHLLNMHQDQNNFHLRKYIFSYKCFHS